MRSMRLIGFWLAACLPLSVFAASIAPALSERALREECSAFSQAGMHDCWAKKSENSQKALRQAEEKVASTLQEWDEDVKYISQATAQLTASNKDFAKYRDSQCEFLASLSGGGAGNAHEIRRLACISELNNKRTEQLRDTLSDLPLK